MEFLFLDLFYINYFTFSLIIFLFGIFGIFLNKRNLIIILLFFELILLATNFNFLVFSVLLDNAMGQVIALYILVIAGSEVSIGLAFLILVYRVRGLLNLNFFLSLKG